MIFCLQPASSGMKLQRFFIEPKDVLENHVTITDRDILNQIKRVLRLRVGARVIFLDNTGKEYESEITELNPESLKAEVLSVQENKNEPELKITICQALCKKDKFEWILQKGTEIGASGFVPVLADRSEKLGLNFERAKKILKEAAEQSERGIIPKLQQIQKFNDYILPDRPGSLPKDGQIIFLDKSGESIKNYPSSLVNGQLSHVNVFIGPEGGWTEEELASAKQAGAKIISLGGRVLRTETAGLVAAAILLNRL